MNVIHFIIRAILFVPFLLLRAIAQGLWDAVMGILTSMGRWIGRVVLPIVAIGGIFWLATKSMPPEQIGNVAGQLIVIAILGYAMWSMVTSPFRSRKKRRRR